MRLSKQFLVRIQMQRIKTIQKMYLKINEEDTNEYVFKFLYKKGIHTHFPLQLRSIKFHCISSRSSLNSIVKFFKYIHFD